MGTPSYLINHEISTDRLRISDTLVLSVVCVFLLHTSGPHRLAWPRTPAFQAGNTGSNPVGDTRYNYVDRHILCIQYNRLAGSLGQQEKSR